MPTAAGAALRFFFWFQLALGLVFTVGLVCRGLELYGPLRYFPFRLFPMFVPLLFFLHLGAAWQHRLLWRAPQLTAAVGLLALLSFGDPLGRLVDEARLTVRSWTRAEEPIQSAFRWVAAHTPSTTVVIAPPWRRDAHYLTQRAQVATWEIYAHDRPLEWRRRNVALLGPDLDTLPAEWGARLGAMASAYRGLTEAQVQAVAAQYGGRVLVSEAHYTFPVLYETGNWRVYGLQATPSR